MINAIYAAVSCLVGYIVGCLVMSRKHRRRYNLRQEAPAPDYDRMNPINTRHEDKIVIIDGHEWHMISP